MLGRLGQRLEFIRRLAVVNEVAALDLQGDFIRGVEDIGHALGQWIFDQRDLVDVGRLAKEDRNHGTCGLEGGVGAANRQIVLQDADEFAEVRVDPIAPGALTLLDDDLDRRAGGREVGYGGQLRPLEDLRRCLRLRRSDEDIRLTVAIDEMGESPLDAAIEMANRVPFLGTARDLRIVVREWSQVTDGAKAFGIVQRHPLGALQEHEVPERALPERHQRDLDVGRIPAGQDGEVGPLEMGRGPNRRQDVGGQRQVEHLLFDDVDDGQLPGLDPCQLLRCAALLDTALE